MDHDTAAFLEAKVSFRDVGTASLAFRVFGSGSPALLIHGIDWQQVDELARIHNKLTMPVTLVWGTRDPFFPIDRARAMAADFPDYRGMHVLEGGRLLTHEEYPDSVGGHVREFWRSVGPGAL